MQITPKQAASQGSGVVYQKDQLLLPTSASIAKNSTSFSSSQIATTITIDDVNSHHQKEVVKKTLSTHPYSHSIEETAGTTKERATEDEDEKRDIIPNPVDVDTSSIIIEERMDAQSNPIEEEMSATETDDDDNQEDKIMETVIHGDMMQNYPQSAIFLNGNPNDPRYMWTYSFSRFLYQELNSNNADTHAILRNSEKENQNEDRQVVSVYVTQSKLLQKLFQILPPSSSNETDTTTSIPLLRHIDEKYVDDLVPITDTQQYLNSLSSTNLIFNRMHTINELMKLYPRLFSFCYTNILNQNISNKETTIALTMAESSFSTHIKTTTTTTCPVIIHFPIGGNKCDTCHSKFYHRVVDNEHLKGVSGAIWDVIYSVRNPNQNNLMSLYGVDKERYRYLSNLNCDVAYISSWLPAKGQYEFAIQLLNYFSRRGRGRFVAESTATNASSTIHQRKFTICFAGRKKSYEHYEKTMTTFQDVARIALDNSGVTVSVVDLKVLNLVEQVLIFQQAGKHVHWTTSDMGPRVVYLALASGAKVLTTNKAQIVSQLIDNDCLVTEMNITQAAEIDGDDKRRQYYDNMISNFFFNDRDCSTPPSSPPPTFVTTTKATKQTIDPYLREQTFYGPLIQRALRMWRELNSLDDTYTGDTHDITATTIRKNACLEYYQSTCETFFGYQNKKFEKRQKKKEKQLLKENKAKQK